MIYRLSQKSNLSPLLLFTISYGCGAAIGWHGSLPLWIIEWSYTFCSLALVGSIALFFYSKPPNTNTLTIAFLSSIFFLFFGISRGYNTYKNVDINWDSQPQYIEGIISTPPIDKKHYTSFRLLCSQPQKTTLHVYVYRDRTQKQCKLGEHLTTKATILRPHNKGNPDEFDYENWLKVQGVSGILWIGGTHRPYKISHTNNNSLSIQALLVREQLKKTLKDFHLEEETLGVVTALTLGDRSLLSSEVKTLYADAGASHLLALSGMHLGILIGFFLQIFNGPLRLSRWRYPLAAALFFFIWSYAFITGLSTSLVRACIMTSCFLLATLMNRSGKLTNQLLCTVLILILINPSYLFDIGAQLSCLAIAGIYLIHNNLVKLAYRKNRFKIYHLQKFHLTTPISMLSVSISAQVFTLPIIALTFHQIPLYAPIFNLIFIPLTTVLIYIIFLFFLFGSILPISVLCPFLLSFPEGLVTLEREVMEVEGRLPGAVIRDFWSEKATPQLIIYNNASCPAIHWILSPEESYLGTIDEHTVPESDAGRDRGLEQIEASFFRRRLTAKPQHVVLRKGSKGMMRIGHLLWVFSTGDDRNGVSIPPEMTGTEMVVVDASLSLQERRSWRRWAAQRGVRCYDIATQGALQQALTPTDITRLRQILKDFGERGVDVDGLP